MDPAHEIAVDDPRPAPEEIVDGVGDGFLVARDRRRRHQHHVALADADLAMIPRGDARQRCGRLTLAAGDHQHPLLLRESEDAIQRQEYPLWWIQIAEIEGDRGILLHGATGNGYFAAARLGRGE